MGTVKKPLEIKYQGRLCSSGEYTRKPGLAPDFGYVDMPRESLPDLKIASVIQPFRFANSKSRVFAHPMRQEDIQIIRQQIAILEKTGTAFIATLSDVPDTTVIRKHTVNEKDPKEGANKPLLPGGTLIFDASNNGEDPLSKQMSKQILTGIHIHPNGLMETMEDLLVQDHKHGDIRLHLTDLRYFYRDYGIVHGRFNVKMPNGRFDIKTLKNEKTPWSVNDLLILCIKALPGSPDIGTLPSDKLDEPENIIWTFERPAAALQELLARYNLQFGLSNDNTAHVYFESQQHTPDTFISSLDGVKRKFPVEHKSSELQGTLYTYRPSVVTVVGKPIRVNVRLPFQPVTLDIDNKIKGLDVVLKNWNYSLAKAQKQAFKKDNYLDIDRSIEPNTALREMKRRIARECFFKWFMAFPDFNFDNTQNYWFPMRDRIVARPTTANYLSDLIEKVHQSEPGGSIKVYRETASGGQGRDEALEITPRVLGPYLTQRQIASDKELIEVVEFERKILQDARFELSDLIFDFERILEALITIGKLPLDSSIDSISSENVDLLDRLQPYLPQDFFGGDRLGNLILDIGLFLRITHEQVALSKEIRRDAISAIEKYKEEKLKQLVDEKDAMTAILKSDRWESNIKKLKQLKQFKDKPYPRMWFLTYGEVPQGMYNIKRDIGLIMFGKPVGVTRYPYTVILENQHILSSPPVICDYSIDLDTGHPEDYTYVNVARDEQNTIKALGINTHVYTTPYVVSRPDMTLYLDRDLRPFNSVTLLQQAVETATPILNKAQQLESRHYVYEGFLAIEALFDVTGVTWQSDGDRATTIIEVNDTQNQRGISVSEREEIFETGIGGKRRTAERNILPTKEGIFGHIKK